MMFGGKKKGILEDVMIVSKMLSSHRVCKARIIQHVKTAPLTKPYEKLPESDAFLDWMDGQGKEKYQQVERWQALNCAFFPIVACYKEALKCHRSGNREMAVELAQDTANFLVFDFSEALKEFALYLQESS